MALPTCTCGGNEWQQGGGTLGGGHSSLWYTCGGCGRQGVSISQTLSVFLLPAKGTAFSESAFDWVNTVLAITSRAYAQAVDVVWRAREQEAYERLCEELGLPAGTRLEARDGTRALVPPGGWRFRFLDPAQISRWDERVDELNRSRSAPYALVEPPALPLLPDDLVADVRCAGGWRSVDREASCKLDAPADPLREAHMRSFRRAFAAVGVYRWQEVPNRYYDDLSCSEPWFEFKRGARTFLVGPRKSVVNVTVTSAVPFSVAALREVAAEDRVTYQDDGAADAQTTKVTVHAWTDEKLVEYLKLLLEEAP